MATQGWTTAEVQASEFAGETIAAGDSGPITISDAGVLFSAEFVRIGDDLVLRGADGGETVLTDYFLADPPPALVAPNGAMLLPDTIAALTLGHPPVLLAQAGEEDLQLAQAGPPIGQVETLTGTAQAIRNGVTIQINVGDPVFQGDVVQTGPGSALGITFLDGSVFQLSAGARMVLDQMVYDPAGSNNSMFFDLVQGTFVFVTGQVAPTGDMRIDTPISTIGIRGTTPIAKIRVVGGEVQVDNSLARDPDGTIGGFDVFDLLTGQLLCSVNSLEELCRTFSTGQVEELEKSPTEAAEDVALAQNVYNTYATFQQRQQQEQQQQPGEEQRGEVEGEFQAAESDTATSGGGEQVGETDQEQLAETETAPDAEPIETAAGPDAVSGGTDGGVLTSGGIGSFDEPESGGGALEVSEPTSSDTQVTTTTSPPPSSSTDSVSVPQSEPEPTSTQDVSSPPTNAPPEAIDDQIETEEGSPVVIPVLANDSDPNGNTITVTSVTQPIHGNVAINPDGTLTYVPDPGFSGTDTFTYVVSDGIETDTATVTVTVNAQPVVDEVVVGTLGPDIVTTGEGNDTISSLAGNDTIFSGGGNDVINAGLDDDIVDAGAGDDTVEYAVGDGSDRLIGGAGNDTLIIAGAPGVDAVTITGTTGDPNLTITVGDTNISVTGFEELVIQTEDGADTIIILGDLAPSGISPDTIIVEAGTGDDAVDASGMTSTQSLDLQGGGGIDTLTGGPGDDVLSGGPGNDTLTGSGGDDFLDGGDGTLDVAVFDGNLAEFGIEVLANGDFVVTDIADASEGTDVLRDIEVLRFDDQDFFLSDVAFTIAVDVAAISEDAGDSATFTITLSGGPLAASNTASVTLSAGGTATGGTDYEPALFEAVASAAAAATGIAFDAATGVLTFDSNAAFDAGGLASLSFTVTALDDSLVEDPAETIQATLSAASIDSGSATISGPATATVTVIDSTVLAAPVVTGVQDDTGVSGADGLTNDNTLVILGTAEANATVEVFLDGISLGTTVADGAGNWAFDHTGTALADGSFAITAQASDESNNTSSPSAVFNLTVDTTAPVAPVITGVTNDTGTPGDGVTSDNTVVIVGIAEANATVEVFLDGISLGTTLADGAGNWTFDHTDTVLGDGSFVVTAQAIDAAGNTSPLSAIFDLTVDTTAPAAPVITGVTDDTGTPDDGITSDNTLVISGTAEANTTVEIFLDGVSLGTTPVDGAGSWAFDNTASAIADGVHELTATATDAAGNTSPLSAEFTLTVDAAARFLSGEFQLSGAFSGFQALDPRTTYLRTSNDPGALDATAFALANFGFVSGDILLIQSQGDYQTGDGFPDDSSDLIAVLSESDTLLAGELLERVPDAIDADSDVLSSQTFDGNLTTDIPEDFEASVNTVAVPDGANFIFFSPNDSFFGDNSDPDGDFGFTIEKPLIVGITGFGELTLTAGDVLNERTIIFAHDAGSTALATISGTGTRLTTENLAIGAFGSATMNVSDGGHVSTSFLLLGAADGGSGVLNVTSGSQVEALQEMSIGDAPGSAGTVLVSGVESTLTVGEADAIESRLRLGFDGGSGLATIEQGATLNAHFIDIGRGGTGASSGTLVVTDPGTVVNVNNDFGHFLPPFELEGGFIRVARDAGDVGQLSVLNGARLNIASGDEESEPGLQVARNVGSVGTVLVDGNASIIEIVQTNPADLDNGVFGPFVQVGRGGDGTLTIRNGGEVRLAGDLPFVGVARDEGSTGLLEILTGGRLTIDGAGGINPGIQIGRNFGSTGSVVLDGLGSILEIVQSAPDDPTLFGPYVQVGLKGQGSMAVSNGAELRLIGPDANIRVSTDSVLPPPTGSPLIGPPVGTPLPQSTFSVLSGGKVIIDGGSDFAGIRIGDQDGANALAVISGPGSELETRGLDNTVQVGRQGTGSMLVEDGGVVRTLFFEVGRVGTGTATVTGNGSVVIASNDGGRFSGADDLLAGIVRVGRDPGSQGTLEILAGARMEIRSGIGVNENTTNPGLMIARDFDSAGMVLIDSATLEISQTAPSDPGNGIFGPFLQVARGGDGALTVQNGGQLTMTGENSFITIARNPSSVGTMLVDGAASQVVLDGTTFSSGVHVGRGGQGTLAIQNDATFDVIGAADFTAVTVGGEIGSVGLLEVLSGADLTVDGGGGESRLRLGFLEGSSGTMVLSGLGTTVTVAGTTSQSRIEVGREGEGFLETSNGANVDSHRLTIGFYETSIGAAVVDNATWTIGSGRLQVGREGQGTLMIQNGSTIMVNGDTEIAAAGGSTGTVGLGVSSQLIVDGQLRVGVGIFDPFDPFGQDAPSFGTLNINGGDVTAQDVEIGSAIRGDGTVLVEGGSLDISAFLTVAVQGTAILEIVNGGIVSAPGVSIGDQEGSTGTLNASGPGSHINVIGPNLVMPSFDGVGIVVGRNGVGNLNLSAGAIISITSVFDPNDITTAPNFDIGVNATGAGMATVSGSGSSLTLTDTSDNEFGSMDIGRSGTGTLNIFDGAFVANDAQGITTIARETGSTGTVLVEGTNVDTISIFDAGFRLLVGEDYDFDADIPLGPGTGGTGTLIIGEFGTVIADEVYIGTDGTVQGTGAGGAATENAALNAGTITVDGGSIDPGFSAGTLSINGDFSMASGRLDVELGGTGAGLSDLIEISGTAELSGGLIEFTLIDGYVPAAEDAIVFLSAGEGLSASVPSLSIAISGVTTDFQFDVSYGPSNATFTALNDATGGNSVIFQGGDLDDVFEGGAGDDVLSGSGGSDRLTGGAGSDLFLLGAGDGGAALSDADFFTDFQDGADLIGLTGGLSQQDLSISASETGDAVITVSGSGEILATLQGVTQDMLDQSDFISLA